MKVICFPLGMSGWVELVVDVRQLLDQGDDRLVLLVERLLRNLVQRSYLYESDSTDPVDDLLGVGHREQCFVFGEQLLHFRDGDVLLGQQ